MAGVGPSFRPHLVEVCPQVADVVGGGASVIIDMRDVVEEFHFAVARKGMVGEETGSLRFGEAGTGSLNGGSGHSRGGDGFDPETWAKRVVCNPIATQQLQRQMENWKPLTPGKTCGGARQLKLKLNLI